MKVWVVATKSPVFLPGARRRIDERGREVTAVYPDEPRLVESDRFIRCRLRVNDLRIVEEPAKMVVPTSSVVDLAVAADQAEKG